MDNSERHFFLPYDFFQGIPCLCGENVMEAMWGLQNLMHLFLPGERRLTKEDRLPTSHGLKKVLSRNGFDDVEPEMVSKTIWNAFCNIASFRLVLLFMITSVCYFILFISVSQCFGSNILFQVEVSNAICI